MKRITTLTGKNIPRLSVARGGWPGDVKNFIPKEGVAGARIGIDPRTGELIAGFHPKTGRPIKPTKRQVRDFTRVCDDMGLKLRDEK
jgi:hypothetical protein